MYSLQESKNKRIEFHQTLCEDIFTIQPQDQVIKCFCHKTCKEQQLLDSINSLFKTIVLDYVHRLSLLQPVHFENWLYFLLQANKIQKKV